jgi:alpha-galactosidase
MREGCIGEKNSRIGKWKLESGKQEEAISEQIAAIKKQGARSGAWIKTTSEN